MVVRRTDRHTGPNNGHHLARLDLLLEIITESGAGHASAPSAKSA